MFIQEAIAEALENRSALKRAEWMKKRLNAIVIPTNHNMPLDVGIIGKSQCRTPNWNPTPEDLMADDWEVVNNA